MLTSSSEKEVGFKPKTGSIAQDLFHLDLKACTYVDKVSD